MDKATKFTALLVGVITLVIIVVALLINGSQKTERVLNAKIRYFDGSSEMIPLKDYRYLSGGGMVKITTAYGDVYYVGSNNIIIIEETGEAE